MNNIIWAADPGLDGAIVVIDGDIITHKVRIQSKERKSGGYLKKEMDIEKMSDILKTLPVPRYCALEVFNPIGKNSSATIASLFRTSGQLEGILACLDIPVIHVLVNDWKKRYNLIKKTKRESIKTAQIIYPSIGKLLVKEADFAEAALIGHYSKTYIGGNK